MAEDIGSLLERARIKSRGKLPLCSMYDLLKSHPSIQELLDNTGRDNHNNPRGEGFPYSVTAEVINETYESKVDYQVVSRHIRGKCGCGK